MTMGPVTAQEAGPSNAPLRRTFVMSDEDDEPVETVDPSPSSRSKRNRSHDFEDSDDDIELLPGPPQATCFREPDIVFLPNLSTVKPVKRIIRRIIIRRITKKGSFPHLSRPLDRRLPAATQGHVGRPIQLPTLPGQLPTPPPSVGSSSSVESSSGSLTPRHRTESVPNHSYHSRPQCSVKDSSPDYFPLRNPYAPPTPPNLDTSLTSDSPCPGPSAIPTPPKTPDSEIARTPAPGLSHLSKCAVVDISKDRGKGLILTRSVKRGELIVAEAPLGVFDYPLYSLEIDEVMASRSKRQKAIFNTFSTIYGEKDRVVDIVETNAIPLATEDDEDTEDADTRSQSGTSQCAMFELISRVNHSCAPNAVWKWKPEEGDQGVMHLRAWKDLSAGEELLCCYDEDLSLEPLRLRQERLREKFKFTCTCPACTLPLDAQAQSDRRLQLFQHLAKKWAAEDSLLFARDHRSDALAWLTQMVEIIDQEERWALLEPVLADLFEVYAWWGQEAKAKATAQRLKNVWEVLCPEEVAGSGPERFAKDPKCATDWAFLLRTTKPTKATKKKIKVVAQKTVTLASLAE